MRTDGLPQSRPRHVSLRARSGTRTQRPRFWAGSGAAAPRAPGPSRAALLPRPQLRQAAAGELAPRGRARGVRRGCERVRKRNRRGDNTARRAAGAAARGGRSRAGGPAYCDGRRQDDLGRVGLGGPGARRCERRRRRRKARSPAARLGRARRELWDIKFRTPRHRPTCFQAASAAMACCRHRRDVVPATASDN